MGGDRRVRGVREECASRRGIWMRERDEGTGREWRRGMGEGGVYSNAKSQCNGNLSLVDI